MKAITLHRPWAWAIVAGGKDIENRTWKPHASVVGQRIAIHAGIHIAWQGLTMIRNLTDTHDGPFSGLPRDAFDLGIVGTAVVSGHVVASKSPWFEGPVGWVLSDVRRLAVPIPCKGAQGLWNVPEEIAAQVLA